jgi:hypothetical protein
MDRLPSNISLQPMPSFNQILKVLALYDALPQFLFFDELRKDVVMLRASR